MHGHYSLKEETDIKITDFNYEKENNILPKQIIRISYPVVKDTSLGKTLSEEVTVKLKLQKWTKINLTNAEARERAIKD